MLSDLIYIRQQNDHSAPLILTPARHQRQPLAKRSGIDSEPLLVSQIVIRQMLTLSERSLNQHRQILVNGNISGQHVLPSPLQLAASTAWPTLAPSASVSRLPRVQRLLARAPQRFLWPWFPHLPETHTCARPRMMSSATATRAAPETVTPAANLSSAFDQVYRYTGMTQVYTVGIIRYVGALRSC